MTRPHDMGGRFGDGPVIPEAQETAAHEAWHDRALALTLAAGALGQWNIDVSRHARECLAPSDYTQFTYYEKWLAALTDLLVQTGVVTTEELTGATPVKSDMAEKALHAPDVSAALAKGHPVDRPSAVKPAFEPGDWVVTRRITGNRLVDGGHTRLPQYAAGAKGRIMRLHGSHIFPDSSAHRLGEAAEPVYAVAFAASELWTHPEHPRDEVVLDLWQSYLEPHDVSS